VVRRLAAAEKTRPLATAPIPGPAGGAESLAADRNRSSRREPTRVRSSRCPSA